MKKILRTKEESPNLQKIMRDFCAAKQAVYNYDAETFAKKVKNFEDNITNCLIIYKKEEEGIEITGTFDSEKKRVIVISDSSKMQFSSIEMQRMTHELNHAWNYVYGKRVNIIVLPKESDAYKKYLCIMEALNEAETQVLCSDELKNQDPAHKSGFREFSCYHLFEESIFKTLCVICNQNGIEFLRSIDGMDVNELISYISERTGYSLEETSNYLEQLGLLHSTVMSSYNKFPQEYSDPVQKELKKILAMKRLKIDSDKDPISEGKKILQNWINGPRKVKEYIPEYQEIYELSKKFIEGTQYGEKDKSVIQLKFQAMQDVINEKIIEDFREMAELFWRDDMPQNILEAFPNLRAVEHDEYDKTNPDTKFEFGRIQSPELIECIEFQYPWSYKQKNKVQESIEGQNLFARVTASSVNKARNFIQRHLNITQEKEGESK